MRPFLPRSAFELSALPEILAVEQPLTERRPVHTAFATTLLTIDHCGPAGSDRHDALKGLTQAWDSLSTTVTPCETLAEPVSEDSWYAVMDTDRDVLCDLGDKKILTTWDTALEYAQASDRLELVHIRPIHTPETLDQ